MKTYLNDITNMSEWAHQLLVAVLQSGDFVIDLTAGRGHDTLWLAQQVEANNSGRVLAFDVQQQAIDSTSERLSAEGFIVHTLENGQSISPQGVSLYHGCHSQLEQVLYGDSERQVKGIIANFGYLPGADHATTTATTTSCSAVRQATQLLAVGGRMALVLYTGHGGALDECAAIEELCCALDSKIWDVLRLQPANRRSAPYVLVLEKKR
ncbi:MAG: class I SAM-dependent methyltransferase [Desulfuromonas sp.]|nr:class I SAM-dependent methyltransferase [Desulfuromonas sp.]